MRGPTRKYVLFGLGTALLLLYLVRLDYGVLVERLEGFPARTVLVVLALNGLVGVAKVARWRALISRRSTTNRLLEDYLEVNASFFMGLVTPGTVGELSRALSVPDETSRAFGVVVFEKITDLGVLLLLVSVTGVSQFTQGVYSWLALPTIVLVAALVYGAFVKWHDDFKRPIKLLVRRLLSDQHEDAIRSAYRELYRLTRDGRHLIHSSAVSLFLWLVPLAQMALIYEGLGLDLFLKVVALLFFLPYLIGIVSMVPLGLGTFDASLGALALAVGATTGAEAGIVAAAPLLYRVLVTFPIVLFGYGCQIALTFRVGR